MKKKYYNKSANHIPEIENLMLPNFLQVTNPFRTVKTTLTIAALLPAILLIFAGCGKKKKVEEPADLYSDGTQEAPTKPAHIPESVTGLQEWLDTSSVRDAKPAVLRRLPSDQFEHFRLMFPDSLQLDALGITDSTKGTYAIALGIDDTLRYLLGRAYVLARSFGGEIGEIEIFTVPEPADQVMMLEDALERIRNITAAMTGTHRDIAGMKRTKLSPVTFPVIETVRKQLGLLFSTEGIAAVMNAYGIVEKNGNVWIREESSVPTYVWDEAELDTSTPTLRGFESTFSVPAGEDTMMTLKAAFIFTVDGWKISNALIAAGA